MWGWQLNSCPCKPIQACSPGAISVHIKHHQCSLPPGRYACQVNATCSCQNGWYHVTMLARHQKLRAGSASSGLAHGLLWLMCLHLERHTSCQLIAA